MTPEHTSDIQQETVGTNAEEKQWTAESFVELLDELSENDDFIDMIADSKLGEALYQKWGFERNSPNIEHEWIEPQEINNGFQTIFDAQNEKPRGKSGHRPSWVGRVYNIVQGRENEFISLDEFAEAFPSNSKKTKSSKIAATAISWVNSQFRQLNINLELASDDPKKYRDYQTYYHFRLKPTDGTNF